MNEQFDLSVLTGKRLAAHERAALRDEIKDTSRLNAFKAALAKVLNETTAEDPHSLEDMFIFGRHVQDVMRGTLELKLVGMTKPVVAFAFGFAREPLDRVFEANPAEILVKDGFVNVKKPAGATVVTAGSKRIAAAVKTVRAGKADSSGLVTTGKRKDAPLVPPARAPFSKVTLHDKAVA